MKYNPQCMTDVINCIIANLKFVDEEPNCNYDFMYINLSVVFSNEDLQTKYTTSEIKFCLAILCNKELIVTSKVGKDEHPCIKGITKKGYEELFELSK